MLTKELSAVFLWDDLAFQFRGFTKKDYSLDVIDSTIKWQQKIDPDNSK